MKLYEVEINERRFHLYVLQNSFTKNSSINLKNEKEILSEVHQLTIGKLFQLIKTSLDMKYEVLVIDKNILDIKYDQLHRFHSQFLKGKHLYLNISIKNKIVNLFNAEGSVNDFQSLEDNNKLINFFS